jgi:hypothetical protein
MDMYYYFKGKNIIDDIKDLIFALYDVDAKKFKDRPEIGMLDRDITYEGLDILKRFVQLIVETNYIPDVQVRRFLCIYNKTYVEIAEELNITPEALRKKVFYYCSKSEKNPGKIKRDFGDQFIHDINCYPRRSFNDISDKINEQLSKQLGLINPQSELLIKIPKGQWCNELDESEFQTFLITIMPFTKKEIERATSELTSEQRGYYWYLVNNQHRLQGVDEERWNELKWRIYPDKEVKS